MNYGLLSYKLFVLAYLPFCMISCSDDFLEDYLSSEDRSRSHKQLSLGASNAVKKAYQMTDLSFTPVLPIDANAKKYYYANREYQGLIYSSVKEIGTYVGDYVSFHTFMTAIHNPHSKIYTERIDSSPYHGINCRSYYGTMCSGLVSYALGINYATFDFPVSELMVEVDKDIDSLQIADILWDDSHVALITDIIKDNKSHVKGVEISEAIQSGCQRYILSLSKFNSLLLSSFKSIYRYKYLDNNVDYNPIPEFVAVWDEIPTLYMFNNDLCADKGDMACYREDEDVVINIMRDFDYLDIYKDGEHYKRILSSTDMDVNLHHLPYGDYRANICYGYSQTESEPTYWKVVNMVLTPDRDSGRLFFKSANAIPYRMSFTDLSGSRKYPYTQVFSYTFTDEDRSRGYIDIPKEKTKREFPYIHFFFSSDYGIIQDKIINWFE